MLLHAHTSSSTPPPRSWDTPWRVLEPMRLRTHFIPRANTVPLHSPVGSIERAILVVVEVKTELISLLNSVSRSPKPFLYSSQPKLKST
ncbi:hypothetical protein E2C01_012048 [Portunus trituberculatus]|uniref:Uncharacterized protein n=1 Tax=Portunus trituberculatus TaxID=210409 RepID=A0A5B7DCN6_PORTR|nr:hypothetical protein [Portunus trituberculatus]